MEDDETPHRPKPELLSLPVELRECIYEHYLASLRPPTLTIAKYPSRSHWTIITSVHCHAPALLRTCKSVAAELQKVVKSRLVCGPDDGFPLSRGPTIRIEPRRIRPHPDHTDNSTESERTIERANIPAVLDRVLRQSAPSIRLHLVMPQSPTDSVLFTTMIRFIACLCNARATALKHVRAIRDPVSGPGWAVDVNAVAAEVASIRCESMVWENWYRSWYGSSSAVVGTDGSVENPAQARAEEVDVEKEWQRVLESCRSW